MSLIQVERDSGVAIVTLNRPERRNALNAEMMIRLAEIWDEVAQDDRVRVVLLGGAGERAFCAGADLDTLVPLATGARAPRTVWERRWVDEHQALVSRALLRNAEFCKPVVAALNGMAVAAGFELMLAADIRLASPAAGFQLPEVRHGLIPSGGALARLPRQIGWVNAMEIVMEAAPVDAERALAMGLINRLVAAKDLDAAARVLCGRIAEGAPLAVMKAKEAMLRSSGTALSQAFAIEEECQAVVLASEDAREGSLAFTQRRAPRFSGR